MKTRVLKHRQRGVALIFVLMIFAIVTVVAVDIVTDQQRNTEKHSRYLQYFQARHYAAGAEEYARLLLEDDFKSDKKNKEMIDHWFEPWAETSIPFPVNEGEVTLMIIDDQGRFNLNLLSGKQYESQLKMLERLLVAHNLDASLASRIRDWIDEDQEPLPSGAEDTTYLSLESPYRTSDSQLVSVSELNLLQLLAPEDYRKILPLVSVLPESVGINMNTVSAGVLQALGERISESDATGFVDSRSKEGFKEKKEIAGHLSLRGKLSPQVMNILTLNSHYFSAYIQVHYRDMTYSLQSRLARNDEGRVMVIGREVGQFPGWVKELRDSVK